MKQNDFLYEVPTAQLISFLATDILENSNPGDMAGGDPDVWPDF